MNEHVNWVFRDIQISVFLVNPKMLTSLISSQTLLHVGGCRYCTLAVVVTARWRLSLLHVGGCHYCTLAVVVTARWLLSLLHVGCCRYCTLAVVVTARWRLSLLHVGGCTCHCFFRILTSIKMKFGQIAQLMTKVFLSCLALF